MPDETNVVEETEEKIEGWEAEEEQEEVALEEGDKEPKFTLPDESEAETTETTETTEIVHNGQIHKLTKEKMVELAQKGFDYDFKIGPHGKLAQIINDDPAISKMVDDYLTGGATENEDFLVAPMEDFDSDDEWLQANIKKAMQANIKKVMQATSKAEPVQKESGPTMADDLRSRDPEYFDRVFPKLEEYAQDLTMADYRKVDTDMGSLCKFYDYVKEKELRVKPKRNPSPRFSIKSGGGNFTPQNQPVWKLSNQEFQRQLDKAKGF